eukprot:s4266_g1.t1
MGDPDLRLRPSTAQVPVVVKQHGIKGRVLVASKDFAEGEILMWERPLLEVQPEASVECQAILEMEGSWDCSYRYPGLFYWAALQSLSLSESDQSLALQLHRPQGGKVGEDVRAVLEALGMDEGLEAKVEELLQIWIFNSLRSDDKLVLPLLMAMCSHDCSPNAFWSFHGEKIELRAGRSISQGEEVTISYLGAGDLCLPSLERQRRLQVTKDFLCSCERCSSLWDDVRVFVCPRCQGTARARRLATCVGPFVTLQGFGGPDPTVEAVEAVSWSKLRGAVVELCEENSEAALQCDLCGPLGPVEAAAALVPEADFAQLLFQASTLSSVLGGCMPPQASEAGLAQEALPLLWRAQRCGLAAEHWVVEALRGYAAEEEIEQRPSLLRARCAATGNTPRERLKRARLRVSLAKVILQKTVSPSSEMAEIIENLHLAREVLVHIFGASDPEVVELEPLLAEAEKGTLWFFGLEVWCGYSTGTYLLLLEGLEVAPLVRVAMSSAVGDEMELRRRKVQQDAEQKKIEEQEATGEGDVDELDKEYVEYFKKKYGENPRSDIMGIDGCALFVLIYIVVAGVVFTIIFLSMYARHRDIFANMPLPGFKWFMMSRDRQQTDIAEYGQGEGADLLKEYIECACSGVMACSTCHVYLVWIPSGTRWFQELSVEALALTRVVFQGSELCSAFAMLPIEPRLKPLGATIIHYADGETKAKFTRCHSFSGYVPYFLSDSEPNEPIDGCAGPVTPPSNCSNRGGATPETDVGEASPRPPVWPDTDEEGDGPCPRHSDQASSESGESEGFSSRLNSKASVWPNGQALWGETTDSYDSGYVSTFGAWGQEATYWEMQWPERQTPIGEKDIEEYIWHLYRHAGCRSVCFVYAFVYICRMSELNAGKVELSPRTCHRLLLAAITIAAKMQQPNNFDASVYAAAGNVTVQERVCD